MGDVKYRCNVGLNYPGKDSKEKRAEAGDVVDDLPAKSIGWLEAQGLIECAEEPEAQEETNDEIR